MRVRVTAAVVCLLVALAPCVGGAACDPVKVARACCSEAAHCCCSAGKTPSQVPEPATAAARLAPPQPADLAAAWIVVETDGWIAGGVTSLLLASSHAAAPVYLSACSFRC